MKKSYPSKVLLFGEYTIINGSQALAFPLENFSVEWSSTTPSDYPKSYSKALMDFSAFIKTIQSPAYQIDSKSLETDLKNGWCLKTSIPVGYGLGSSGAVCAAILDRYGKVKDDIELSHLKTELAKLENFFHGSSSGIDPLVCLLNKGIFIKGAESIVTLEKKPLKTRYRFFLIDTEIPRSTEPLVKWFLEQCKDPIFDQRCTSELSEYQENAIHFYLKDSHHLLMESMHAISYFQFKYFKPLIPALFHELWLEGLNEGHYKLKLCGAGGGGFILGYTKDLQKVASTFQDFRIIPILK